MRAVRGTTSQVVSPPFVGADGDSLVTLDATPTVTVTRADGTVLTEITPTDAGDGKWRALLTPATHTNLLDRLTVGWSAVADGVTLRHVQTVDVVERRLVTVAQVRSQRGVEDPAKFPAALLDAKIGQLEDVAEDYCQVAFCRRFGVHETSMSYGPVWRVLAGQKQRPLRSLRWLTVDGEAQDVSGWVVDPAGAVTATETVTHGRVVRMGVEYGYDSAEQDLIEEGVRWVREKVLSTEVTSPSQAISETTDGRTIRYSTPDPKMGRPTGSLDLDAVLKRVAERIPGVA